MAYAINDQLLNKARAAATRLASAEGEVDAARAEYHAVVRRIHLAGAPLREIAQELGLSHQRVQQIVDAAGGSCPRDPTSPRLVRRTDRYRGGRPCRGIRSSDAPGG